MPALITAIFLCTTPTFHDGDNIRCGGRTMRLAAIDAPELAGSPRCYSNPNAWCDTALAIRARDNLRAMAEKGPVLCHNTAHPDRYRRPIVRCTINGVDIGGAQLRAGYAKPWP